MDEYLNLEGLQNLVPKIKDWVTSKLIVATEEAPGFMPQLSGDEGQALLGNGTWGELGKGGSTFYVGTDVKRNQDTVEGTVEGAIDGDMYYNTETSDLFRMESGSWVYKATLAQGSGVEFATEEEITAAIGEITWG